jgi:hypothetical protein
MQIIQIRHVMLMSSFLHFCFAGLLSSSTPTLPKNPPVMPMLICPTMSTVDCDDLAVPFTNFESFEDEGGSATGIFVESSFVLIGTTNPSLNVLQRTYRISDLGGNTASCNQVINITGDTEVPVARCKPLIVKLGGTTGQYTINPQTDLNIGSTGDCGIRKYETDKPFVGCNDIGTTINYILTVTDNSGKTSTCTSTISTNSCPQDTFKALNANCSITIPDLTFRIRTFMPCQRPVTNVVQTPAPGTIIPNSRHNMRHTITFVITNGVGLTETCSFDLIAMDNSRPTITCKTGLLTVYSEVALRPDTLFSSVSDNCGTSVLTFDIRRADNNCESNTPDDFGPYTSFCCADVGRALSIVVRATDQNGNSETCSRSVKILDRNPASFLTGSLLPDITISCQYPLNLNNLSAFGTIVSSTSTPSNIVIADPGNPFYPSGIAGRDGVFSNCDGGTVTVTSRNTLNSCSQGKIFRDFVVTDLSGNRATYTQTINVRDVSPFNVNDITWPTKNVNFESCSTVTPDPNVTGRPIIRNDKCSRSDATFKDQKFTVDICGFIKRTWTVIDWCQYQTNNPNSLGIYTFVQNISYTNKSKPTMTGRTCRDTTICVGTNCQANLSLTATATDDCQAPASLIWSYKLDLNNNNTTDATGTTNTLSNRVLSKGIHAITWTVKDRCSNATTCKSVITVKDCTAPSIIARSGLSSNINSTFGNTTIWASEFVYSAADNCTPIGQIKYSFSANVNNTSKVYTCANRGNNTVEIWATDLDGNQSKVTSVINIQDNNKYCTNANDLIDQRVIEASQVSTQFLGDPSPNPYNESLRLSIKVEDKSTLQWMAWDVDGKIVVNKNQEISAGQHVITLDDSTQKMIAGIYFYKVVINQEQKVFRVIKL